MTNMKGMARTVGLQDEPLGGLMGWVTRRSSEKGSMTIHCWAVKGAWLGVVSRRACPSQVLLCTLRKWFQCS